MDGFSTQEELYERVKPTLKSRVKDLKRIGINYVQDADVWNYLKNNVWGKKSNLTLGEMVNDIMTVGNSELESYIHEIISKQKRERETESELL